MAQNVKTVCGVAIASVKTVVGVAIADVKTIVGVDNTGGAAPTPDILWWEFTDGSGTTVTATVGPNGTTDADWVTGKTGSGFALQFNGTSDDANTVSSVSYGTNIVTICGWFFIDDTTSTRILFESSPNFFTNANSFVAYLDGGNVVAAMNGTAGGQNRNEQCAAPSTGSWVHIAFIFDGSTVDSEGEIYIYFDAVVQSTTTTATDYNTTANFADYTLSIASRDSGTSLFYDGRVDDFRIYSGNMSADLAAIMADAA